LIIDFMGMLDFLGEGVLVEGRNGWDGGPIIILYKLMAVLSSMEIILLERRPLENVVSFLLFDGVKDMLGCFNRIIVIRDKCFFIGVISKGAHLRGISTWLLLVDAWEQLLVFISSVLSVVMQMVSLLKRRSLQDFLLLDSVLLEGMTNILGGLEVIVIWDVFIESESWCDRDTKLNEINGEIVNTFPCQ
jgi:hypothetical protein